MAFGRTSRTQPGEDHVADRAKLDQFHAVLAVGQKHRWVYEARGIGITDEKRPLTILDWEGFGLAPAGFDAASLHAYSLPDPAVADHVRDVFADELAGPGGRLAELLVAAIILQAAERDPTHARLAPAVRNHLAGLLGQV